MTKAQSILPEFDHEMKLTRTMLQRVPGDKHSFKPHPKSMAMDDLAAHIAEIPGWVVPTLEQTELDLNPPGGKAYVREVPKSNEQLLAIFDKNAAAARNAIEKTTDDQFMVPWSLLFGGNKIFTMPRAAVLRAFVLSHLIHHRAQLGLYLRLNDIAVPSIYGPSADEGRM